MTSSTEICPVLNSLIVVTGASTGMGAATARELARRGYQVLAGVRKDADGDAIRAERIEPIILDITDASAIAAVAARVDDDGKGRPLRALVNNAGIAVNAPVETLPLDEWRWQFEVNLFGHIAMTQALMPALMRSRGTVVNISSIGGKVSMPTYGAYAGTKHAMEAVSDALRREVADQGVKVAIVEPGGVSTEMSARGIATAERLLDEMTPEQRGRYARLVNAITAQSRSFTKTGVPAADAAKVIAEAATAKKPRVRYTIGRDAAMITKIVRLAPDRTMDRILRNNLKPHFADHSS